MNIAFLGAGSMGRAILAGLVDSTLAPDSIITTNRDAQKAESLQSRYGSVAGFSAYAEQVDADANVRAATDADLVLVAVKPNQVRAVLTSIASVLKPGAVVVSVAAGISTASMAAVLPNSVSVVRAMPNTPAIVGLAVTGITAAEGTPARDVALAKSIFETVGRVVVVSEPELDAVGAISGSGPAYFYLFTEALAAAATAYGFSADAAALLAEGTFVGAAQLLAATGESPAALRKQVTSPGGTTAEAIASFEAAGLERIMKDATDAAIARTREIAAGN